MKIKSMRSPHPSVAPATKPVAYVTGIAQAHFREWGANELEDGISLDPLRRRAGARRSRATDSALTGTNLRLILHNRGISNVVCAGIFTDQCVSSTARSLADESYNVVVAEDCCTAGSDELHRKELHGNR
jgi:nicotinamidase-related amidase